MIVAAAPVANRAWIIDDWYRCLAAQSRPPDAVRLLWSSMLPAGQPDDTYEAIHTAARNYGLPTMILRDNSFPHHRHDNERFHTLARLRNSLITWTRITAPVEIYLSIDTDVLLEDTDTISHLCGFIAAGWDVAAPATWLHPLGRGSWAYNAGWWVQGGEIGDPRRAWARPILEPQDLEETHRIDIPMAVCAMDRSILERCRYRWHEAGEDLGFAQDLNAIDAQIAWEPSLHARHVWEPAALAA